MLDLGTWLSLCSEHHACTPALRHFAAAKKSGKTLATALDETENRTEWALWALMEFGSQMTPEFRLWLLPVAVMDDPGTAANLWHNWPCSEAEKSWLLAQWHSDHTGTILFPEMEKSI